MSRADAVASQTPTPVNSSAAVSQQRHRRTKRRGKTDLRGPEQPGPTSAATTHAAAKSCSEPQHAKPRGHPIELKQQAMLIHA